MEALKVKYEQNKAEVLSCLDVSNDLLEVMTRHGLIDITDCGKYKSVPDARKRNASLMRTLVERRNDHAYPLFIQCLREAAQDSVANLLTDIGEETRSLTQLQSELEKQINSISDYIEQEERRTGLERTAGEKATASGTPCVSVPVTDREVWVSVQATLRRATQHFERCRSIIAKLHEDCQALASANGDMIRQVRNSYHKVKALLRPSDGSTGDLPKSTQAMFQTMMDDVQMLMARKTKVLQHETEGRTSAMRLLRHLRDWIEERSSILNALHASSGGAGSRSDRLTFPQPRRSGTRTPDTGAARRDLNSSAPRSRLNPTPSPPSSQSQDSFLEAEERSPRADLTAEARDRVEPHAISTVLEGLTLLEQQVRHYIHLEIALTDKYRSELRRKHNRRKARGFAPSGLEEALRMLDKVERSLAGPGCPANFASSTPNDRPRPAPTGPGKTGGGEGGSEDGGESGSRRRDWLAKLRAGLDAIWGEYDACAKYTARMSASLPHLPNVEALLADGSKDKKNPKRNKGGKTAADSEGQGKSRFGFFQKKGSTSDSHQTVASTSKTAPVSDRSPGLPGIVNSSVDNPASTSGEDSLLGHLKQLVANHEMLKLQTRGVEERFRRDYDHKRRAFDATLREKGEEIARPQIRLKEAEAEKEKYRSLYDSMKIGYVKRH